MAEVPLFALRVLAGGAFVVAFALIAEIVQPKRFAGLFAAAPSVASASLLVTSLAKGPVKAEANTLGMMAGAVAFVVYALAAVYLVNRFHSLLGSAAATVIWLAVAVGLYLAVLR